MLTEDVTFSVLHPFIHSFTAYYILVCFFELKNWANMHLLLKCLHPCHIHPILLRVSQERMDEISLHTGEAPLGFCRVLAVKG